MLLFFFSHLLLKQSWLARGLSHFSLLKKNISQLNTVFQTCFDLSSYLRRETVLKDGKRDSVCQPANDDKKHLCSAYTFQQVVSSIMSFRILGCHHFIDKKTELTWGRLNDLFPHTTNKLDEDSFVPKSIFSVLTSTECWLNSHTQNI